jgi:hypothetical protein
MLVKSRRVRQRRLRPQAGCQIQPTHPTPVIAAPDDSAALQRRPRMRESTTTMSGEGEFWCGGGPVRLHVAVFVRALIETEWRVLVAH